MNISTGEIVPFNQVQQMPPEQQTDFVEVKRDLTKLEEAQHQIALYSPCGCGSGKKFKFCCHRP